MITSNTKYKLSLFIFRRDLRLHDNTALIKACRNSEAVVPCFFLDGELLNRDGKKYRPNLVQFMFESLRELNRSLESRGSRLYLFYGKDIYTEFEKLLSSKSPEAVFLNEDYTPYSLRRDRKLEDICSSRKVDFNSSFDLLLSRPGEVLNNDDEPYRVYSWFFKTARSLRVGKTRKNGYRNFYGSNIERSETTEILDELRFSKNDQLAQRGGRENGLKRLNNIENYSDYNEKRDIPSEDATTMLSAHLKFGTISVREFYWKVRNSLGPGNRLINELYWRDFFAHLAWFFPSVFSRAFNKKYSDLEWENDNGKFEKWCNGLTGFPIVDAGMRQLNTTGWMHNRLRMIVASFLTKDLHVDWRWGERYFASKLVDYDPCSNNGGWQWAASTGADSQPYFRIFNPWRQQQRFDPEAIYIKEYVHELKNVDPSVIHNLYKGQKTEIADYPLPIVDHGVEAGKAREMYKSM